MSDPAQNTQLLSDQLRALGLYAAPTLGDGNCLFRALSDQYFGTPSQHLKLRQEICDWMESHKQRYEPFVLDERGLDVHLRCMREPGTLKEIRGENLSNLQRCSAGTYGGHLELTAFAHLKRRDVKVIQPGLVYVIEWAAGGEPPPTSPTMSMSSVSSTHEPALSDRDARRMRREKKKDLKEKAAKSKRQSGENDDDDSEGPSCTGAVYVAYVTRSFLLVSVLTFTQLP